MKKIITLLLLFVCTISFGQDFEKRAERIKALRVAFISTKLDLTSQEAEKFWPIFNKFDEKQIFLYKQKRQLMFKLKPENTAGMSDAVTLKLLDDSEKIDADMQNNKRLLTKDLQGIIPPQKLLLLKKLEEDFKNTLLKQLKKRQGSRSED
ncbi:sensor of ECF-type sigma factor [Flavobacterium sp.]|uniref:sensor of ECF-type sigma factor n=1 Tax=Flavobacterium sp. TaxID=239 RepID=UPI0037519749